MRTEAEPSGDVPYPEREQEIAWIKENLEAFWSLAVEGFAESGRGALVVDRTQVVAQDGQLTHPLLYVPQVNLEEFEWTNQSILEHLVRTYDPQWEFVTAILRHDSESLYRMGVTL